MIKRNSEKPRLDVPSVDSPADQLRTIFLNSHGSKPMIFRNPELKEVRELLESVEKHYVSGFWEEVLCKTSPYSPQLPFALASWDKNKTTLVRPQSVLANLVRGSEHTVANGRVHRQIASFPLESLVAAVRELKPTTVSRAIDLLQVEGVHRLNASPLIPLIEHETCFEHVVDQLIQRVGQRNGRIAATALVAMRAQGWLALPAGAVKRIVVFEALAPKDNWGSPLGQLTNQLNVLLRELQPPQMRIGERLYKNTTFKIQAALLCTNVTTSADLSWEILYPLLKGNDYLPSLRDHWRALCRSNTSALDIRYQSDSSMFGRNAGPPNWERSATQDHEEYHADDVFPDPSDPSSRVILNSDREQAIALADVGAEEIWPVLQKVERRWIGSFWETLIKPSPFDSALPFGLSATAGGHSLIDPKAVYEAGFGHRDVQSREAMSSLKALGCDGTTALLAKVRPDSVDELLPILTLNGRDRIKCFSLRKLASDARTFPSFVQSLVDIGRCKGGDKAFAIAALIAIRSNHWAVLPLDIPRNLGHVLRGIHAADVGWVSDPMDELMGESREVLSLLLNSTSTQDTNDVYLRAKATIAVLCTNLTSAGQMSLRLVERILACKDELALSPTRNEGSRIRAKWTAICVLNGTAATLPPAKYHQDHRSELRKYSYDSRLAEWIDLLADYCEDHAGGNMEPLYQAYGMWLSWLSSLPNVPSPYEMTRAHINKDRTTCKCFRTHLRELDVSSRRKNMILYKLSYIFECLATRAEEEGRQFTNPIRIEIDKFGEPHGRGGQGTPRSRIPSLVLDEMKSLIVVTDEEGAFNWSPHLQKLPSLFEREQDGGKVFCPILPAIIYIMLVFPLRTHQTRWLDSGEMDEECFDCDSGLFIENDSNSVPGRQSGVIRKGGHNSPETAHPVLDFQVAVNKTSISERAHSSYIIPFLPPDLLWIVTEVVKYQKLHGPPPHLVKEVHEPFHVRFRNQALADLYPDICPLFRYRRQRSFYPPSHSQIAYFWGKLCGIWDGLNGNWTNPATGMIGPRPGVPQMSHVYVGKQANTWAIANYDLHSLRVAGISSLLEAGLPLAVVASLAGHKGLAMTVHYFKPEIGLLRLKLADALKLLPPGDHLARISNYLFKNEGQEVLLGSPVGLAKLNAVQKTGLFTLSSSGICPGASCKEGLETNLVEEGAADVPGARCPLCRFYVYGPTFLPGLVFDFNCLLFELETKARLQARLREELMRAEDAGETGEVLRLRGEDDRLDRDASLDIAVLGRLYQILNECITALNHRPSNLTGLQIINGDADLELLLQRMPRFDQLKDLVEVSQILPATRHSAPVFAEVELKDILMDTLRRNGAEAYLAGLPKNVTRSATLELASLFESSIPDVDRREKLFEGMIEFGEFPGLERKIKSLMANTYADVKRLSALSAGPRGRRTWLDRIAQSNEDRVHD